MIRPRFVYWTSLWASSIALGIYAILRDVLATGEMGLIPGRDFSNMWTSGRLALAGHAYRAFDVDTFRLALSEHLSILTLQNFSYPPHALFLSAALALPPYFVGWLIWSLIGIVMFVAAARPFLPKGFSIWLAASTPAAMFCIWDGQYGLFVGALWLFVYRNCDRKPLAAGVAAGLMTVKPHLGLLVAVLLASHWRALLSAIMTTVVLIALSGIVFGWGNWVAFLIDTVATQTDILTRDAHEFYFNLMTGAYPSFGQGIVGSAAQLAATGYGLFTMWKLRGASPAELAFPAATATFLILPYAFNYDMTVVCLGFAILIHRHWAELSRRQLAILTLGFAAPALPLLLPALVPPVLMLALHLQRQLVQPTAGENPASAHISLTGESSHATTA